MSGCGSLSVLEAFGERLRQLRGPDRRGRTGDVVVGPVVAGGPPLGVELQPRGPRVAITRLADAARVDQPLALGEIELTRRRPGSRRWRRRRAPARSTGRRGNGRSARPAWPARRGTARPAAARARTPRPDRAGSRGTGRRPDPGSRAPALQEGERLGGDRVTRPMGGDRGTAGELLQRDRAGDAEIVVAGQADRTMLLRQRHAGVRIGAVADEVAEAPQLLAVGLGDRIEHGLERVAVAVNVGDNGDLHRHSVP